MGRWIILDPLFILLRNNINCTKKRIRSNKYQFAEKGAMGPFALLGNLLSNLAG